MADKQNPTTSVLKMVGGPMSFGMVMGVCSGIASKKLTKAAATIIGVGFIGVQV